MDWELNMADRDTLRPALVPRIRQCVTKYLLYVQGNGGSSSGRKAWATTKMVDIASLAEQLSHYVMSEPTFIAGGTSIADVAIQSRIESVLNTHFGMPE